ncbi:MAG: MFS transporter, partial [Thermoanaerobaculia bacterium]|nr:MFS transporter [Thermoanaerobaculia bacterium]
MPEAPRPANGGARGVRAALLFLGLRRSIVGLLAMVVLVGLGEKLAERFLPLYLVTLGGGALSIGLLNGLDNFLSAVYSHVGGQLSQRLGIKRALLLFNGLAATGFLVVVAVPSWPAVLAASALFLSWSAISLPASMELVGRERPADRRVMGVSMHSLTRRVPMALGPILGGLMIDRLGVEAGVRTAFALAALLAGVAAVFQTRLIRDDRALGATPPPGGARALWRVMGRPLKALLAADVLVRYCEHIPYAFVVIWAMETIQRPVSATAFGMLTAVEMLTAFAVYLPVAYFADRGRKKPFVVVTFGFFTLFPLALLVSHSFWPLVAAFVVRGLKELGEPTRKAMIFELAPEGRKAASFGLYYLVRDVIVSLGALGGAWLWALDPALNLIVAALFGVAGTLLFALAGREPAPPEEPAT